MGNYVMKNILKRNLPFSIFMTFAIMFAVYYQGSFYDPTLNFIKCEDQNSCLHEATHKYDHMHGDISESNEWKQAVDNYKKHALDGYTDASQVSLETALLTIFPGLGRERGVSYNPFTAAFWEGGWGGYTEYYASVISYTNGDINKIPESLRKFYNMEEINNTMKGLGY